MREVYRILDANFNRAREALRVAEEFARFVLDDPALAAQAKQLRSRLQTVYQALPAGELLASRDVAGDVGADLTSPTEMLAAATPPPSRRPPASGWARPCGRWRSTPSSSTPRAGG